MPQIEDNTLAALPDDIRQRTFGRPENPGNAETADKASPFLFI